MLRDRYLDWYITGMEYHLGMYSYSATFLRANVTYDTSLSTCPTWAQTYEVMVWLEFYGGISPLSDNGYPPTPVATPPSSVRHSISSRATMET
ncbi:MAG: hypothetical protein L6R38_004866 [Xanthoria sp. 2 TBL-2021]|nr:MAG: hypothetical protein L6R38_004866 [Xanthoria sp. 2 TBL-2021]